MNYGQNWFIIPYWKGIGGKMIETELFERIYEAASIQRWNDHIRPSDGFTELDKQAHKLYYAYVLSRVENGVDRLRLIEGCIFEFLHRIILTDLKPPVFYKLMEQKGEQINTWVLSELEPTCKKIPGGFYERFRSYFLDPDYSKTEKTIIKAAHYLATKWEFNIVYHMSKDLYHIEKTKNEMEGELAEFLDVDSVKRILYQDTSINDFVQYVAQLRFQQRWARTQRLPKTSVMGHMLVVALFSYFFSLEIGACGRRICNNFFGGLFHDLPEVLTRDIVSPVKNSVEGLDDVIKEIEIQMIDEKIYPLLPESWHSEIRYYIENEFSSKIMENGKVVIVTSDTINHTYNCKEYNPIDGEIIRAADHLSAYYEAKLSEKIGITSESLMSGAEGLRERYVNKRIGGIDFSGYFTEF